ncbi:MAG TPA: flavin reductase family protein, partial [Candidatus Limnocylindrales bacterium]
TGRFAVNMLGEDQQALSDCFSGAPVQPDREAFCGAAWQPGATGLPVLDAAIASIECTIEAIHAAGDHDLYVARVDAVRHADGHAQPLLYYRGRYLRIERARTLDLEGKPER